MLTIVAFIVAARSSDRGPRIRTLPGGRGLRRQGAALCDRLRQDPVPLAAGAAEARPEHGVRDLRVPGGRLREDARRARRAGCPRRTAPGFQRPAARSTAPPSSRPGRSPTCCWRCCCTPSSTGIGVQEPKPILASPVAGSVAERAGLRGGEQVVKAGFDGEALRTVRSFEDLRWLLTRGGARRPRRAPAIRVLARLAPGAAGTAAIESGPVPGCRCSAVPQGRHHGSAGRRR